MNYLPETILYSFIILVRILWISWQLCHDSTHWDTSNPSPHTH